MRLDKFDGKESGGITGRPAVLAEKKGNQQWMSASALLQ
jgi:hypothetical protein